MMLLAGIAWGFYSIAAKTMQHALTNTLSNFILATPLVAVFFLWYLPESFITWQGVVWQCCLVSSRLARMCCGTAL